MHAVVLAKDLNKPANNNSVLKGNVCRNFDWSFNVTRLEKQRMGRFK